MILEESVFPAAARTEAALMAEAEGTPPSAARQTAIAGLLEQTLSQASRDGLPDVRVCSPNVAEIRMPNGGVAYVCLTRAMGVGIKEVAADALAIANRVSTPAEAVAAWGDPRKWRWSISGRELGTPEISRDSGWVLLSFPGEGWAPPPGRNVTLTVSSPLAWEFEMVVTQLSTKVIKVLGEPTFGNRRGGPSFSVLLSIAEGVRK